MRSQTLTGWIRRVRRGLSRPFVDRFGPKWRHSDQAVRLAAVSGVVTAQMVFDILRRGEPDVRDAVIAKVFREKSLQTDLLLIISRRFRRDPAKGKLGALLDPVFLNEYVKRLDLPFHCHHFVQEGWLKRLPVEALGLIYTYFSSRHGQRFTTSEQCGRGPASPGCGTHPLYREVTHVTNYREEMDAIIGEYIRRGYKSPELPTLPFPRALFPPTWNKF
jgi:hypothetical protein